MSYAGLVAFRDDREALSERIAKLERELAAGERAAEDAARALAEQAALKAQLRAITEERDQLRAGAGALVQRTRRTFAAFALVSAVAAAGIVVAQQNELAAERAAHARDSAELRAEVGATQLERDRARDEATRAVQRLEARSEWPPSPSPPAVPSDGPSPSRRTYAGTLVTRIGRAPETVGARCSVVIDYESWAHDCRATVTCGETNLYPGAGEGFFRCTARDGSVVRGEDTHPTSTSRDPRLDLDLDRGTILVSDTGPDWSVTVRIVPDVPI